MAVNLKTHLLLAIALGAIVPLTISAATPPPSAEREARADQRDAKKDAKDTKAEADKKKAEADKKKRQDAVEAAAQQREQRQEVKAMVQEPRPREQTAAGVQSAPARQQQIEARQAQPQPVAEPAQVSKQQDRAAAREQTQQARASKRLSAPQQQQMISQQKERVVQYRQYTSAQKQKAATVAAQVQQQNRAQQYQYINDYNRRVWEQQQRYSSMSFNYGSDPYFYSSPIYRYQRDGRYYTLNQYGADLLRQAINDGYSEGFHAGRADRMDHWRADYQNSWAYQDASYGYSGYYLDRNDYSYYFRQGFRRGYDDGYYSRYRYGSNRNGSYSILGSLLTTILVLESN